MNLKNIDLYDIKTKVQNLKEKFNKDLDFQQFRKTFFAPSFDWKEKLAQYSSSPRVKFSLCHLRVLKIFILADTSFLDLLGFFPDLRGRASPGYLSTKPYLERF
jgi:hypothetical protein